ncbi:MAG: hypothetical protein J5585_10290, partial [Clostridia bacterium]|nr:hypothetical protein [Clostridia bacterium]
MKNTKTKLLSLFLALVFVFGAVCIVPSAADDISGTKRTLMVYAVGSNLESGYKCFTRNIIEFTESPYNENLDIILLTGGALKWHTPAEYLDGADEISAEYVQIWKVVGKKEGEEHGKLKLLEPTGMEGFEKANTGAPETLGAFVDYCYKNYPADIYDALLWDHGGGPLYGFGRDDYSMTMILLPQLVSALSSSQFIKEGNKFELFDFDACVMANVEVIAALSGFADYFVLSSETERDPGQSHDEFLKAIYDDPSIGGYELGKVFVDEYTEFFNDEEYASTLAVVNSKNFMERMVPLVLELDAVLSSEAKNVGAKNGRYNFYDEMYSLLYSYSYVDDTYSLFDLGNLVGALSVPMSEMDNISEAERDAFENAYTDVAKRILAVISDCDESGDDIMYYRCSDYIKRTVGAGVIRDKSGELVYAADDGNTIVVPTGLSIFFPDRNYGRTIAYLTKVPAIFDNALSDEVSAFFKARLTTAAYYSLIYNLGYYISHMSAIGSDTVDLASLKEEMDKYNAWNDICDPAIDWLVSAGEFADEDEALGYVCALIDQIFAEALSKEKLSVRPILNADGSFDSYQVTISDSSAQNLMSVKAMSKVTCAENDTPEYLG